MKISMSTNDDFALFILHEKYFYFSSCADAVLPMIKEYFFRPDSIL